MTFARYTAFACLMVGMPIGSAMAFPVYDTSAPQGMDSRLEGSGLVAGGLYGSDSSTFKIEWDVTPILGGFHYKYTFTGFQTTSSAVPPPRPNPPSPAISHVILDLSDNCVGAEFDANCVYNATYSSGTPTLVPGTYDATNPSNPGFPLSAAITGVKFDGTSGATPGFVIAFDSNRVPVYGDIYLKGGSTSFVYNNGLTNHASNQLNDFIVVPDTTPTQPVPEPSSLFLIGSGLSVFGLLAWRKRKATS